MHEMSIALNVIDIAEEQARQAGAQTINVIELEIGTMAGVITESLEFCFSSACKGTMAENARLKLIEITGQARCEHCGHVFEARNMVEQCPECGKYVMQIEGGRNLKIRAINVD